MKKIILPAKLLSMNNIVKCKVILMILKISLSNIELTSINIKPVFPNSSDKRIIPFSK